MGRSEPHPRWVDYVIRTRQSYLNADDLDETYRLKLESIYKALAPSEADLVGLFPIAHEDQTAFLVCKEEEAAIFFDVGQSAILKSAFACLRATDPQQEVFRLFLATASLKISPEDRFLADKLGDAWSGPYDGPPFADERTLNEARGALLQYATPTLQDIFDTIVDFGITAHELYHYSAHRSLKIDELEQVVAAHYDEIVRVATAGTGPLGDENRSKEHREKYERELLAKRNYYIRERRMISEEMACDLYAFTSMATLMIGDTSNEQARDLLEKLVALNSIAFNFHLLHLAFTERAKLFAGRQINADLPGWMSLYNLRRVALGVLSSYWSAATMESLDHSVGPEHFSTFSERLQVLQNRIYIEMANDILMPAIPMLKGCFALVDRTFPIEARPVLEPTKNGAERLFFSSLPFRLEASVLDRMLKRLGNGAPQLRQQPRTNLRALSEARQVAGDGGR